MRFKLQTYYIGQAKQYQVWDKVSGKVMAECGCVQDYAEKVAFALNFQPEDHLTVAGLNVLRNEVEMH